MQQIMFTLPMTTPNAKQVCENQNGKTYATVQAFIDTLTQYDLAHEEDIIIYTVQDFVLEFNVGTVADDSLKVETTYMGHIKVKKII